MFYITTIGTGGGLSLVLNVEQYNYMRTVYMSAGVHVLVSEPSESRTLLETRGLAVSVGTQTTLLLSQNRVSITYITPSWRGWQIQQLYDHDLYLSNEEIFLRELEEMFPRYHRHSLLYKAKDGTFYTLLIKLWKYLNIGYFHPHFIIRCLAWHQSHTSVVSATNEYTCSTSFSRFLKKFSTC